jgi:hypothetical protein
VLANGRRDLIRRLKDEIPGIFATVNFRLVLRVSYLNNTVLFVALYEIQSVKLRKRYKNYVR